MHSVLNSFRIGGGYNLFHPVIDGKVLTDFPTKSILAGKFAKVPLIVGYVPLRKKKSTIFLTQFSATTNETLSIELFGDDISLAMKLFFPSITKSKLKQEL